MPIRFSCSACGKKLKVKDEFARRRSKCPECGWTIIVPFEPTPDLDNSPSGPSVVVPPLPATPAASVAPAPIAESASVKLADGVIAPAPKSRVGRLVVKAVSGAAVVLGSMALGSAITLAVTRPRSTIEPAGLGDGATQATVKPSKPLPADHADPPYTVLSADIGKAGLVEYGKDVFMVRLSRKVTKPVLREIAREIEATKYPNPVTRVRNIRTVVHFYLPQVDAYGLDGSFGSNWAIVDLNGPLFDNGEDVEIHGFTIDEETEVLAKQTLPKGKPIGEWIDDSFAKQVIFISLRDGSFYVRHGGRYEQELVPSGQQPYRFFQRREPSSNGDYYWINNRGDLEMHDNDGLIAVGKLVR